MGQEIAETVRGIRLTGLPAMYYFAFVPGNAILLNGVVRKNANREIGDPGFQPIRFLAKVGCVKRSD
jgi:hypothetical protein